MNPLAFLAPYRILIAALAIAAILGSVSAYSYHSGYKRAADAAAARELAIAQSSAKALQAANDKALATERTLQTIKDNLEKQNAQAQNAIDAVHLANIRLAATKRMRDPGYRPTDCRAVPKDPGTSSSAPAPATAGELSDELAQFLIAESYRADQSAIYAKTCHDWAMSVTLP